ncbi:Dper\GL22589-PA-like protein [Anopheles sinensis]|uniref:Dper\GL22589-PA-like protein n=1 Tax=Anopheles sinensis TaxID=74873 RepID=A0A084VUH8_ANOSI|nr:Dper\GL22589-PA-like protein [Anopheles sinensis]
MPVLRCPGRRTTTAAKPPGQYPSDLSRRERLEPSSHLTVTAFQLVSPGLRGPMQQEGEPNLRSALLESPTRWLSEREEDACSPGCQLVSGKDYRGRGLFPEQEAYEIV